MRFFCWFLEPAGPEGGRGASCAGRGAGCGAGGASTIQRGTRLCSDDDV